MFNIKCLIFYSYHCNRISTAKLIIYDENTAHEYVNNCYRHGFFMRETDFPQERDLLFTAYSRQSGHAGKGHPLRHGPRPGNAPKQSVCGC